MKFQNLGGGQPHLLVYYSVLSVCTGISVAKFPGGGKIVAREANAPLCSPLNETLSMSWTGLKCPRRNSKQESMVGHGFSSSDHKGCGAGGTGTLRVRDTKCIQVGGSILTMEFASSNFRRRGKGDSAAELASSNFCRRGKGDSAAELASSNFRRRGKGGSEGRVSISLSRALS